MKKILCIIPARSGSKGIKNKNIKLLHGLPLLAHSIIHAKSSKYVKNMRIVVSTDSNEYRKISIKYGAEVPFLRPEGISLDQSTDYECFIHCLDWLKTNENYEPEIILQLRPTQPCRTPELIDSCLDIMIQNWENFDSVRTIIKAKKSPYKMYSFVEDNKIEPILKIGKDSHNMCRQFLPEIYLHNGYVDIVKTNQVLKRNGDISGKIYGYIMNEKEDYDIDTEEDFKRVKVSLKIDH